MAPSLPELSVVDEDYLRAQIATADGARTFASKARSIRWLEWADRLPDFDNVFSSAGDLSEAAVVLADWFARLFVSEPSLSGAAMQSLRRHQQKLHPTLIRQLAFAIHQLEERDAVAAQKWRTILATSIHGYSAPVPLDPLLPFEEHDNSPHAALVRRALTPFLNLGTNFALFGQSRNDWPGAEPAWPLDAHSMKEHVGAWIDAQQGATEIGLTTLESGLIAAYEMLDAYNGGTTRGVLEWGRSAIEPHPQDQHVEPIDVIINGLRDLGHRAREISPPLYQRWWAFEFGLFRRLALHLVGKSPDLTSDEKIRWVLDRQLLYNLLTKHETFQVLREAVPTVTSEMRSRLLRAVLSGDPTEHENDGWEPTRTYEIYNLLVWLTRADPAWEQATGELARLQADNPDFGEREHPDFSMWHESAIWSAEPVVPIEEFSARVGADPLGALSSLTKVHEDDAMHDDDLFREDYALVRELAARNPEEGLALWDAADSPEITEDRKIGLRSALVYGWTKADLGDAAPEVLGRVTELAPEQSSLYTITKFLLEQSRKLADGPDSKFLEAARRFALSLWEDHQHSFRPHDRSEPSSLALNTWPGDLVYFWIAQIQRRWRAEKDRWSGFNSQESAALRRFLEGPPAALEAIWAAIGSKLYFFDAADSAFTDEYVLPLFGREESLRAVWEPFLYHPRVSLRLLRAGLLNAIVANFGRLSTLNLSRLDGQFESLAASVVNFAPIERSERQQILDAAVIGEDGAHAADFAGAVVDQLRDDASQAQEAWKSWLNRHLAQRFQGIPRDPAAAELARWADMVPALGERITEAAALFHGRGIGLGKSRFSRDFPEGALPVYGPELAAYYAERVQNSASTDVFVAYRVRELVESIRSSVSDAVAKPLIDAALEGGFLDPRSF